MYNPIKGYKYSKKIIKNLSKNKNIKFIALKGMTVAEIREISKKAKVYIDFGHHPGKDRIPRETAILGCIVIVGKRGSARYKEDISINDEF